MKILTTDMGIDGITHIDLYLTCDTVMGANFKTVHEISNKIPQIWVLHNYDRPYDSGTKQRANGGIFNLYFWVKRWKNVCFSKVLYQVLFLQDAITLLLIRGKWGNAGQGVMPDKAIAAKRRRVALLYYLAALTAWKCTSRAYGGHERSHLSLRNLQKNR